MSAKEEHEEYYSHFPDWYWKYGLHDAKIIEINELQLPHDWKSKHPKYNCFEIIIDSKNALYETNITKISLINYKLKSTSVQVFDFKSIWWLTDNLQELPDKQFELNIILQSGKEENFPINIVFEVAVVDRN